MKPRRSLDAGLLALVTVAFSVLCMSAMVLELGASAEQAAAAADSATPA
jgi:hypothetical protein